MPRFRLPSRQEVIQRLRDRLKAVTREHSSPERLGVAVGVGVLLGTCPLIGLQTILALGIAWLFRLNKVAVLLGVQVSVPPLTPLVLFAAAQVGALLVRGHWLPLSLAVMREEPADKLAAELFIDLTVGGLVVGGVLGLVFGRLTTHFVRRQRRLAAVTVESAVPEAKVPGE